MGQIVFNGQKPKYCDLAAITTGNHATDVPGNGEIWLIDSTNSSKPDGTGRYDKYIIGDNSHTASQLANNPATLFSIDNAQQGTIDAVPTSGSNNAVSSNGVFQAIQDIDVTSQISGKLDKTEAAQLYQPKGNYLTEHQDISGKANAADVYTQNQVDAFLNGKQNTISTVTVAVDTNIGIPAGTVTFNNNNLAFSFQNLKGVKGDQGVQGPAGPTGANGVTSEATIEIISGINTTTTYDSTRQVASAEAVQDLVKMLGTVYYVEPT